MRCLVTTKGACGTETVDYTKSYHFKIPPPANLHYFPFSNFIPTNKVMSRIGKLPVSIPEKVTVTVEQPANTVKVEGPKGKLEKSFDAPVEIKVEDNQVVVAPRNNSRFARAMYGTTRSIVAGMVEGVTNGFSKNLEVKGVGFRAQLRGNVLNMNLGYSHDINFDVPEGITITVTDQTKIKVEGFDKQLVGMVASQLEHFYKPEPYKGKGVHIEGKFYRRKEGKTVGK